jgi:hypothetical protein
MKTAILAVAAAELAIAGWGSITKARPSANPGPRRRPARQKILQRLLCLIE